MWNLVIINWGGSCSKVSNWDIGKVRPYDLRTRVQAPNSHWLRNWNPKCNFRFKWKNPRAMAGITFLLSSFGDLEIFRIFIELGEIVRARTTTTPTTTLVHWRISPCIHRFFYWAHGVFCFRGCNLAFQNAEIQNSAVARSPHFGNKVGNWRTRD